MLKFLVRQVILSGGSWAGEENVAGERSLVCPLCAASHNDGAHTAAFTQHGYISCSRCNKLASVFLSDGTTPVVPYVTNTRPDRLTYILGVYAQVKEALVSGRTEGIILVIDQEKPTVTRSYVPNLIMLGPAAAEGADDGDSIVPLWKPSRRFGEFPPDVERLLAAVG